MCARSCAQAVQRVLNTEGTGVQTIQPLAESLINPATYPEKILVQTGNRLVTVAVADIYWIDAEGDYAKLITNKARHLSNYGIGALETRLNPKQFIRVHRSAMINLHFVQEIQKHIGSYDVIMQNGDVVRVSRSYMDRIRELTF